MAGDDLEILLTQAPVTVLVLESSVGKVHLLVVVRQLVLTRPAGDLLGLPIGSSVGVVPAAIPLLQEPLVVPLELVIENHSPGLAALLADVFLGALV